MYAQDGGMKVYIGFSDVKPLESHVKNRADMFKEILACLSELSVNIKIVYLTKFFLLIGGLAEYGYFYQVADLRSEK